MASSSCFVVAINVASGGGNNNRQQNGSWAMEIGFYYEKECVSSLKGQLSLNFLLWSISKSIRGLLWPQIYALELQTKNNL